MNLYENKKGKKENVRNRRLFFVSLTENLPEIPPQIEAYNTQPKER